ncbi:hypothetical protein BKA70DRAFT_1555561 [Coprinopsis sp. MPI-PUGE-AT-0042]|nr:hypothetical protein BKA70DRAFT_1555561 [Coprinopsis sp. MPI-PUGE-AT-0042]
MYPLQLWYHPPPPYHIAMSKSSRDRQRALADIQATANKLKKLVAPHCRASPAPLRPASVAIPELSFDDADFVSGATCSLQKQSIPQAVVEKIMERISQPICDLKASTTRSFVTTCQRLAAIPSLPEPRLHRQFASLRTTYQKGFCKGLETIRATIDMAAAKWLEQQQQALELKQQPFNADAVPLLEKYLQHNAYPPSWFKEKVAKHYNMSPKQVGIWFQNRRRRDKEQGRPVRQPLSHEMWTQSDVDAIMAPLCSAWPSVTVTVRQDTEPLSEEESVRSPSAEPLPAPLEPQSNPLWRDDSAEDFPLYEPVQFSELASFLDERPQLPPPEWYRSTSQRSASRSGPVDMDAFVEAFDRMLAQAHCERYVPHYFYPQFRSAPSSYPHPSSAKLLEACTVLFETASRHFAAETDAHVWIPDVISVLDTFGWVGLLSCIISALH